MSPPNSASSNRSTADSNGGGALVRVRVWDLPTRLFHWGLVVAVTTAGLTGWFAPKWWINVHVWSGYAVLALLTFRIVWAAFGSDYSRLASFAFGPAAVIGNLKTLFHPRPPETHIGHNPAGAAMIYTVAAVLLALVATGLIILGGIEKDGPLASAVTYAMGRGVHGIHEALAAVLAFLVGGHLAGVAWESWREKRNLAAAMITGDKVVPAALATAPRLVANARATLATLAGVALLAGAAVTALNAVTPKGRTEPSRNATFAAECAACHQLYHPSLLPASEWRAVMGTLANHFGEDASLSPAKTTVIRDYLVANAAEHWDTKAAHRFRAPGSHNAGEITATAGWKRIHRHLSKADFAVPAVKGPGNCLACHRDAAAGTFRLRSIHLPKGVTP